MSLLVFLTATWVPKAGPWCPPQTPLRSCSESPTPSRRCPGDSAPWRTHIPLPRENQCQTPVCSSVLDMSINNHMCPSVLFQHGVTRAFHTRRRCNARCMAAPTVLHTALLFLGHADHLCVVSKARNGYDCDCVSCPKIISQRRNSRCGISK